MVSHPHFLAVATDIRNDLIMEADFSVRPFRCVGDSGEIYLAERW